MSNLLTTLFPCNHGITDIKNTKLQYRFADVMFTTENYNNIKVDIVVEPVIEPPIHRYDDVAPPRTIDHRPIVERPLQNELPPSFTHMAEPVSLAEPSRPSIITPNHTDTLFWCLYIVVHGYNDYLQIGRNYGVKELEIKQKIGEYIKTNASKLKNTNYKVTKACVQEILSEMLTSQKETSMICLIAMTVHFNINVVLVQPAKKIMVEFIGQKDAELPWYILYKDTYGKYTIQESPATSNQLEELRQTNICLDSYLRPLKPMTTYKADDLIQLATKLGSIDLTTKIKKQELYEQLSARMQWI